MKEEWRDVEEHKGVYQVSNLGNVRRIEHTETNRSKSVRVMRERMLKPRLNTKGYMFVSLSKDDKKKTFYVHRMVAKAFIPNPNNYPQINHKDEDRKNNCVDNLEWCTNKYNCNYGKHRENVRKAVTRVWEERRAHDEH